MNDDTQKFRHYRTLVWLLAFIIAFEVVMLFGAVPVKTTFITVSLCALAFLCFYLIVLCLRLIRELQEKSKKR